jgi:hypothetical protein
MLLKEIEARIKDLKEKRHIKALNETERLELIDLCMEQRKRRGPGGDPETIGIPKPKPRKKH